MVYSGVFNNVFEALNLQKNMLQKFSCLLAILSILHSSIYRVLAWLSIGDFHHANLGTMAIRAMLYLNFRPLCSGVPRPVYSTYVSLTTEKTRKENGCQSRE